MEQRLPYIFPVKGSDIGCVQTADTIPLQPRYRQKIGRGLDLILHFSLPVADWHHYWCVAPAVAYAHMNIGAIDCLTHFWLWNSDLWMRYKQEALQQSNVLQPSLCYWLHIIIAGVSLLFFFLNLWPFCRGNKGSKQTLMGTYGFHCKWEHVLSLWLTKFFLGGGRSVIWCNKTQSFSASVS